ncbi:MAG: PaaI family thioesterase [Actinobacteria bacterium]|nr:PaaI family thioesterase [Actinomycetota bacterium]
MDKEMMVQVVEKGCPFAQRAQMKLREIDEGEGRITAVMEDDPANYNAFGLVHAGAMCGLAETTGGMAIFRYLDPREVIILNTVFNIRFSHPPRGELRCTARVVEEEAAALMEEFKKEGKADKALDLKILDSSGNMVAQAQATFRLISTPEEYKKYFGG